MSILTILNIGAKGMQTAQIGTAVAGQNVSNVGTDGYNRRSTNVLPGATPSTQTAGRRVMDQFVEKRLLGARSSAADANAERLALETLDGALAEVDGGIGPAMDAFQAAMQDLTARPNDNAVRRAALARAAELGSAFNNTAAVFDNARVDANSRIVDEVANVNSRLTRIADLNKKIVQAEVDGSEASDFRDQRDMLIRDVADRLPVTVIESDEGGVSLLMGGTYSLVSHDGFVGQLGLSYGTGGDVGITQQAAGQTIDVTQHITSGSIGGILRARDGAIAEARLSLDQLAYDVTTAYNDVHGAGVGLDGGTGRNLFATLATVDRAALNFDISTDVLGQPDFLAAASDAADLPSNNENALALAALSTAPIALGGMSVTEAMASLVSGVGFAVQSASYAESYTTDALTQVQNLHDSVSNVSSDEEMITMMRYQRAYQASLKVVQVADEMLSDLMRLRG